MTDLYLVGSVGPSLRNSTAGASLTGAAEVLSTPAWGASAAAPQLAPARTSVYQYVAATSPTTSSFAFWISGVMWLPDSIEAKPHWGEIARDSRGL